MDWSSWGLSHTIDKKVITKYEKLYTKYWLAALLKANVLSCPRRTKFYFNACATEDILGGWGIFWVAYKRWRGSLFETLEARRSGAAKSKVWSTSTWRPWVCLYTLLYSLQMSMCKSHTIQNVTGASWQCIKRQRKSIIPQSSLCLHLCICISSSLLKDEAWRAGENIQSFNPHVLVRSFEMLTDA